MEVMCPFWQCIIFKKSNVKKKSRVIMLYSIFLFLYNIFFFFLKVGYLKSVDPDICIVYVCNVEKHL